MPKFLAKLLAGGLSAAVILVWWPVVFPADSVASWLARGVTWTLAFEVFTVVFAPLERALWETAAGARLRDRAVRAERGLPLGRSATLACSALAVVAFLLTFAPDQPARHDAPVATKHVTEVRRVVRVVREPVEVTRVVSADRGSVSPAPTAVPVRAAPVVAHRSTRRATPSPRHEQQQPVRVSEPAAPAPADSAAPAPGQTDAAPAEDQRPAPKRAARS